MHRCVWSVKRRRVQWAAIDFWSADISVQSPALQVLLGLECQLWPAGVVQPPRAPRRILLAKPVAVRNIALVVVGIECYCQQNLFVVAQTNHAVGLLFGSPQHRQQHRDQERDDGDDYEQLHQRERTTTGKSHNGLGM